MYRYNKYQAIYTPLVWPLLYFASQVGDFVNIFINKVGLSVQVQSSLYP